jgi:hypothetical protein
MTMYFRHTFAVTGRRPIPLEMLCYDQCFPIDDAAIDQMVHSLCHTPGPQTVQLGSIAPRHWQPTADRWRSFMWSVSDHKKEPLTLRHHNHDRSIAP